MLPAANIRRATERLMSPTTRYAFIILSVVYGVYQFINDRPVPALIGLAFAGVILWLGRKR
jgi:hypothetical protein